MVGLGISPELGLGIEGVALSGNDPMETSAATQIFLSSHHKKLTTLVSDLSVSSHHSTDDADVGSDERNGSPARSKSPPSKFSSIPTATTHGQPSSLALHKYPTNHPAPMNPPPNAALLEYEQDSEPIHIVRTVFPDEHPLKVRDEMMALLLKVRQNAEEEMGLRLGMEGTGVKRI